MSARLLLPALAFATLAAAPPVSAPVAGQNVLAANREGLIDFCLTAHLLDLDADTATSALARRRRGAGDAGDSAYDKGENGKVMQGSADVDIFDLGAQVNRPVRWLCNEMATQASRPEPLPTELQ